MSCIDKKYIEINICDFYNFLNDENLSNKVRDYFIKNNCCIYNKHNSFVFERFFTSDELECEEYGEEEFEESDDFIEIEDENSITLIVNKDKNINKINIRLITLLKLKEFLKEKGYSPYPTYIEKRKAESKSIVPNYDGVLFDLTW